MSGAEVIAALGLPASARVDRRVPRKLLVENGATAGADRRRINEGVADVHWVAALKPTTIGVAEFRDPAREYVEIAVMSAVLNAGAQAKRLVEIIHRAVPYPVLLSTSQGDALELSLGHKRWSQGEAGAVVLDGELVVADLSEDAFRGPFFAALALARQPRTSLYALYQGWLDTVLALLAARVTGSFEPAASPERAAVRRSALGECTRLEALVASLSASAARETQLARQVELNVELQRVRAEQSSAREKL
jgi:hypothetical protein